MRSAAVLNMPLARHGLLLIVCLLAEIPLDVAISHLQHSFLERSAEGNLQRSQLLKEQPYYHSTDEIHNELAALSSRCKGMTVEAKQAGSQSIDVVNIKAPGTSPLNKNFMLFGEHAREMISPESSLHFIKTLCGESGDKEQAKRIMQSSEFRIVVNANPESRRAVEDGDYCLRSNPNGVDLNRNWATGWQADEGVNAFAFMAQSSGGERPFSEPETQLFKDLILAYKPTSFISIHSGTRGMYMPWAYNGSMTTTNQEEMLSILRTVDRQHCQCPFGTIGRDLCEKCGGTSLDWVYAQGQTHYAFVFEIYAPDADEEELKRGWERQNAEHSSLYQNLVSGDTSDASAGAQRHRSNSSKTSSGKDQKQSSANDDCFSMFNPDTKQRYDDTLQRWSSAYLNIAGMVAAKLQKHSM